MATNELIKDQIRSILKQWLQNKEDLVFTDDIAIEEAVEEISALESQAKEPSDEKIINPATVLQGFMWNKENELPKKVFHGSFEQGFEVDQTVLLEYLMKFYRWTISPKTQTK